ICVIAALDHPVRTRVVQRELELNPLFLLLSILGGVEVFGLLGIFIGPLLLAVIEALVDMLRDEIIASKMEQLENTPAK
ncbi:MAG: AI-2E family transporter, partial [Acidobacteriales bacterium]|nr:AI-2E family transporter [Terriglobales bacterium]